MPAFLSVADIDQPPSAFAVGRYDQAQAQADYDRAIEHDPTEDEFAVTRTETCQLTGPGDH